MGINKKDLKGTVVALKANFLIVEIEFSQALFYINKETNPSETVRLICTKRNKLSYNGYSILVGDIVLVGEIDWVNYRGVINSVKPRISILKRPSIANFTDLFVVISLNDPLINLNQLSRFLVKAEYSSNNVNIILTKSDLGTEVIVEEYIGRFQSWGYNIFPVSIINGHGFNQLLDKFRLVKLSVLCGPSGVGKSSLINYLVPGTSIPVGDLSRKSRRGKHTTRHVEIFSLGEGSFIADTPGFNQPGFNINPYSLGKLFPELRSQLQDKNCKFRNCLHLEEPGCIVSRNWERYDQYRNCVKEMINSYHPSQED